MSGTGKQGTQWHLQQLHRGMDAGLVREAIQFEWPPVRDGERKIATCQFIRAYPDSEGNFSLHYEISFEGGTQQLENQWYAQIHDNPGEVIDTAGSAGQAERVPIPLSSLGLSLRPIGWDEQISGLTLLHNPQQAMACLETFFGAGKLAAVQTELLSHRLGESAVIRFLGLINGRWHSLIGRAYSNDGAKAWQAFELMQMVWAQLGLRLSCVIPEPIAYLPDHQMIVMQDYPDALPGDANFSEQFYRDAGTLLYSLHQNRPTVDRDLRDQLCGFHWADYIGELMPDLKRLAFEVGEMAQKELATIEQIQGQPVYGHFDLEAILNNANKAILFDLGCLYQGDVAQDLGYFLASAQTLRIRKGAPDSGSSWAFLSGYREAEESMRPRIVAYQRAALYELAFKYALWPARRHYCEALLQTALS